MNTPIVLSHRRRTLPFHYRETSPERITLKPRIDLLWCIKQLFILWRKQPGRWYTGNSFNEGVASNSSEAGRRSPERRLNTVVFYIKIGDSEVRHDFHDDGFTITGSHTILHQKLLFQPRKSGVTLS
jgi:hypothetical protein